MNDPILFCIPYAGGSSMSFSNIASLITIEGLEIQCLELAGRGLRHKEPVPASVDEAVEDLYSKVQKSFELSQRPVFIWGHSMGAILALLLSFRLVNDRFAVAGLLVSGMKAPTYPASHHTLSEKAKNKLLSDLLPIKYEQNKEAPLFQRIYQKRIKIMEKDVEILEKYQFNKWPEIFVNTNISVIMGKDDELYPTREFYENWKLHTSGRTDLFSIKGDHFFPMQYPQETADLLTQIISQTVNKNILYY
ncbi:thioesterase [Chryseobacterium phosphatilyticum]|uniref:Thioesterase n=1 Tax=Chryseobacterium phosphatilyticum TaxID=475075 RepID=A0A316XLL0_9FLAO|nr:alpha/beta fold hydrolase [Chryseobacterium phosphatilyticum]PWN71790.1 thioesterase [Chryseobacterium phosphatilyticum]